MLAFLLAAAIAPATAVAPAPSTATGLRDVAPSLRELPRTAPTKAASATKGLVDPFSGESGTSTTASRCTQAQQAAGATTVRCRTRLRSPFG